ncbi:MAG: tRNA (adenosine(37)-N6)-threonylcarbamoyltransferase complex ATPase subunit type 1 TsaE [Arenimonas sp.]
MSWREFLADSAATDRLGTLLAQSMAESGVVFLRGDLGAGKSSLARAMLRALGVSGAIKSPTYTLIERYPLARGQAVHLDLYRIAEAAELEFLGLDDLGEGLRLWLVEWPERAAAALPPPDLEIGLEVTGSGRVVELQESSDLGRDWLLRLSKIAPLGGSS